MEFFQHEKYRLVERKDEYLAQWAREMLRHPSLGKLDLTARQRRVIASLIWWKKVCESNGGTERQPPPVAGLDAKKRIVVQKIDGKDADGKPFVRMWAVSKNGEPADLKEPVTSLKTGRRVTPPPYARDKDRW